MEYTITPLLLYTYITLLDTNTSPTSGFGLFVLSIVVSYLHHFGFIKLKTPTRERERERDSFKVSLAISLH